MAARGEGWGAGGERILDFGFAFSDGVPAARYLLFIPRSPPPW